VLLYKTPSVYLRIGTSQRFKAFFDCTSGRVKIRKKRLAPCSLSASMSLFFVTRSSTKMSFIWAYSKVVDHWKITSTRLCTKLDARAIKSRLYLGTFFFFGCLYTDGGFDRESVSKSEMFRRLEKSKPGAAELGTGACTIYYVINKYWEKKKPNQNIYVLIKKRLVYVCVWCVGVYVWER